MNADSMADWTITSIHNVVHVESSENVGFVRIGDKNLKIFSDRRYHGLVWREVGRSVYTIRGEYRVYHEPNTLVYLPMGEPYVVENLQPGCCRCVNFFISEPVSLPAFSLPVKSPRHWGTLFAKLLHDWTYPQPGSRAKTLGELYVILATLAEELSETYLPGEKARRIRSVMDGLNRNPGKIQVPELAEDCGMSERAFRQAFHQLYGTGPKEYLLDACFRQAKSLLADTDSSVTAVAQACGYESIYAFSRAFQNHEGVTPREFRRKAREAF